MDQLLDGLIVVEASRDVAVRYCGRLFAQFGAAVVRAEGGDDNAIGYAGPAGEAYGRWLDAGKLARAPAGPVDLVIAGLDAAALATGEALCEQLGGSLLALTWFHQGGLAWNRRADLHPERRHLFPGTGGWTTGHKPGPRAALHPLPRRPRR